MFGQLTCFLGFLLLIHANAQEIHKLCAKKAHVEECVQIDRDSKIKCKVMPHNTDCLIAIGDDAATFGTVTPDEAAIAAQFLDNLRVVAEIRSAQEKSESEEFRVVVLVKDRDIKSFADLRNRKLCHPGYGRLNVPNYVIDQFEDAVLEKNYGKGCGSKGTIVEDKLGKLAEFFGASCKPGQWVHDITKDRELKKKYADRLCGSCDGLANDKCAFPSANNDPFSKAMECFQHGDIVITTAGQVNKTEPSNTPFYYLCRDGTVSKDECHWSRKPWNLIIANKKNAQTVTDYLKQMFYDRLLIGESTSRKIDIKPYLENVLRSDHDTLFEFVDKDLKEYVHAFNYIPESDSTSCDAKLKWCVTSEAEQQKCEWFEMAVRNQGILPGIGCEKRDSRVQCLKEIEKRKVDIVTIDNNLGYTARKYKLKAIAFPETDDEVRSMVVVKNLQNNIQLSNLKGKKGCFAEFGDIAYISFFENLNNSDLVRPTCDYGAMANEFLGESCVPGINDDDRKPTKCTDKEKLCKLCASSTEKTSTSCAANHDNKYFRTNGALECLRDDVGEFAVISNRNISEEFTRSSEYIVLCRNGSLANYAGFDVDDGCYLSITSSSELVVKSDFKYYNDSVIALSAIEVLFGQDLQKPFDLFGVFNGTKDLMFKDSTPGLNFIPGDNKYTNNYVQLFNDFDNCIADGKSSSVKISTTFLEVVLITVLACSNVFL